MARLLPMIWLMMSVKTVRVYVLLSVEVTEILAVVELIQRLLFINIPHFAHSAIMSS